MKKANDLNIDKQLAIAREKAKHFAYEFGLFPSRQVKCINSISLTGIQTKIQLNPDNLISSMLGLNLN